MRKLLWLLLAVAVLVLGAPFLVGVLAEREAYKQIELVQDNPVVTLKISNYDRGWFKSDVTYEYGLKDEYIDMLEQSSTDNDAENNGKNKKQDDRDWREITAPLELLSQVTHGPIVLEGGLFFGLFRAETTTGPDNPRLNKFLEATNMPYLFVANNTTGFTGTTDFTAEIPPINADANDLPAETELRNVEFSGMNISGQYDAGAQNIVTDGGAENLSIIADNLSMTLLDLKINTDTSIKVKSMPMGTVSVTINEMTLFDATADQAERMELSKFSMFADTQAGSSARTADAVVTYQLAAAKIGDEAITDMEVTARVSELSIEATENYSKWSENFLTIDQEDPEAAVEMMASINPIAYQFMQTSPTIAIEPLKFTANGEPFDSNFSVSVDGSKLPELSNFELTNIPMWMDMLTGGAGVSISESLAKTMAVASARSQLVEALGDQEGITEEQIDEMAESQAPMVVETLVQQGMIAREGERLATKVSYEGGELLLNGNPMPIGALLGGL